MKGFYLDTSAALKLLVTENASEQLSSWLAESRSPLMSSSLLVTELVRAARQGGDGAVLAARSLLNTVYLHDVAGPVLELAAHLTPTALRSLDAIHLATALQYLHFLGGMVTYDQRLAAACREHGVPVVSPGVDL